MDAILLIHALFIMMVTLAFINSQDKGLSVKIKILNIIVMIIVLIFYASFLFITFETKYIWFKF